MPTAQFYHVITTTHVPYHVCGAQQDNSTACVSSSAAAGRSRRIRRRRRSGVLLGRRRRERLHRQRSAQPRHLLRRQLRRSDHPARSSNRSGARDQSVSGQPDGVCVGRHRGAIPVDVPDRDGARPTRAPSTSARSICGRSTNEGQSWVQDQPGPDAPRSENDGRVGRPDHEGQHRRRDLRDDLHDRAVADATPTSSGPDPTTDTCRSRAMAARTGRTSRRKGSATSRASA